MCLLLCRFWAKPPSALGSLVYSETKTSCKTGYSLQNPTAFLFQSYAKWLVSLTLRQPHHAKEGLQSWFLLLLSAASCFSSAAWFLDHNNKEVVLWFLLCCVQALQLRTSVLRLCRWMQVSQWPVGEPSSGGQLEPKLIWFISGVTLSKWVTELNGFWVLKTKPLWFS